MKWNFLGKLLNREIFGSFVPSVTKNFLKNLQKSPAALDDLDAGELKAVLVDLKKVSGFVEKVSR